MERYDTLLIACPSSENRKHLRGILEAHFNLLEVATPDQMLLLLQQNISCICAVLVDSSLRYTADKLHLLQSSSMSLLDRVPVIVICSEEEAAQESALFFRYGAADVIPLHYDPYAMLRRIETVAELHMHKQHLEEIIQQQADILQRSNDSIVEALSSIIEYRSLESSNHILRVRSFTRILMEEVQRRCPEYGLTDSLVAIISNASVLHDIGKISTPDSILMKPGPLTPEEREIMKGHTVTGYQILRSLENSLDQEYLRYAHNICHYHHERWDGSGYPEGLSGDDIPICAQVVGLADAYDALTSKRIYKDSYSFVEAVNTILKGECGAFSPKLLDCFKNVTDQFDALTREYADGRSPEDSPFDTNLPAPVPIEDTTRAMCYALVHYINAFMMEVDLDLQIFHVLYNPYPEIASMQGISTLQGLKVLVLDHIVVPQEREALRNVLSRDLNRFLEEDLRRASYQFHYQTQNQQEHGLFELTFLRHTSGHSHRSLAILCRKLEDSAGAHAVPPSTALPADSYICHNDRDFTLVRLDEQSLALGGYSCQELQDSFGGHLAMLIHPEDREMVRLEFDRQLQQGPLVRLDHRVVYKNGTIAWVSNKSRLITGNDGQEYLYCSLSDISPTKAALEELKARMHRYDIILAQTENVLFEWDIDTDTIDFSDTWEQVFGENAPRREHMREILGGNSLFHPDDIPMLLDSIHNLEKGSNYEIAEARISSHRGRYIWCRFRASALRDPSGCLQKVVGIIINIDAEKSAQKALQERADRDSLTHLLNKTAGRKQAEAYLSRFPGGVKCAMLIIDLDNFKQVNDQYGHLFGDAMLSKAARAIEKQFQAQDIIARIGGDEFMVLVRGTADRNLLDSRCRRLLSSLNQAFHGSGKRTSLSCSIGVALAPEHGTHYYDLYVHADHALYQAKAKGKNTFCFYDGSQEAPASSHSYNAAPHTPIDSDVEPGLAEDNLVRISFQKLYTATNVEAVVNELISMLGRKMNVSRVYIFENTEDNLYCSNTFEWCNQGITPEIQNLQMVSYETDIPGYQDNFNEQGVFYLPDIASLPSKAFEIVDAQGIKSMLQCAIRQNGVFRGYIGFDECVEQRFWTKEEIHLLTYFSDVLATFLLKHREHEQNRLQADELRTILDNQSAWIYIVDPDTCRLKYLNQSTRRDSPAAAPGMLCYKSLLGRDSRCPGCPSLNIRQKKTARSMIPDEKLQGDVLAEATIIQWRGEESCLMTCHLLSKPNE